MSRGIVAIGLLALCAGTASAGMFSSGWEEDQGRALACFRSADADPDARFLAIKVAISSTPTMEQLSDERLPSSAEVPVIRRGLSLRQPCRQMLLEANRKHHPYLAPAVELRFFQDDLVFVELLKSRISYGNATRLLQQSFLEFKAREATYNRANSDAQRRAAAESLDRANWRAQVGSAPPGTGRMTCRWVGQALHCESY